ncbi:MAG: leucine-rich repeat domain-containing protein, partial [Clostridia bacterium]|nr:leucine-rich repeat domain-containing protein [Clostridia bacterium]
MKKLIFVAVVFILAIIIVGCSKSNPSDETQSNPAGQDTASATTAQIQTETVAGEPEHAPYELFKFNLLDDGTYEIKARQNVVLPDNLVLPASYEGKPVTVIGKDAFKDYRDIVSVVIPDGYTVISNNAFFRCTDLSNVSIPDGIKSIGDSAFFNCSKLTSIKIPDSVTN